MSVSPPKVRSTGAVVPVGGRVGHVEEWWTVQFVPQTRRKDCYYSDKNYFSSKRMVIRNVHCQFGP